MFEIVEKGQKPFPLERAVLISIVAHVLFLVAIVSAPESLGPRNPERGLLAAFLPPKESDETRIPIVYRSAPGPARDNPRPSDFSDKNRRAGGGDRSKARSASPFFEPRPGIEGLEPGRRGREAAPSTAQLRGIPLPRRGESPADRTDAGAPAIFGPSGGRAESPVAAGSAAPPRSGEAQGKLSSLDQAIRDAAREAVAGGGQEGAGFPNPEGGFVDSGPLSFDTTWYDWGAYAEAMVRRIKLHWNPPEDLLRIGVKGKLTIRFFILADGRVDDARIIRGSGIPPFDFAALQAILKSSPFRPLPSDLGSSREGVTVTFFYNLRPDREGRSEGAK
jgi:TonB family protein